MTTHSAVSHSPTAPYPARAEQRDRCARVNVKISGKKPARYNLGMTGAENLDGEPDGGDFFGLGVGASMGCVTDIKAQTAFKAYRAKQPEENTDIAPRSDLFIGLLKESAQAHPKYQRSDGDPVYSGRSTKGDVCTVYVRFIGIETEYAGQE